MLSEALKDGAVEVRSSPIHGRGAFAAYDIHRGQAFHTAHMLVFDPAESALLKAQRLGHYLFHVEDTAAGERLGIALSPLSFLNHRRPANVTFVVDGPAQTVIFTAARDIAAGEELTIDYGDYAAALGLNG